MRKQKASHESGQYMSWAITFLALLFLVFAGSIILRFISFLNQSSFDGQHQFNILETSGNGRLLSFNPDQQSIVELSFAAPIAIPVGQTLEVPIDGTVADSSDSVKAALFTALLRHKGGTIPKIDLLRLWWMAMTLPKNSETQITVSGDVQSAQNKIASVLQDKSLYAEGKTITISNAAGVQGLGNRLAKLLTAVGANVIMVTTADTPADKSAITFTGTPSYTGHRLEHILHVAATQGESSTGVSDITITIGKDLAENDIF